MANGYKGRKKLNLNVKREFQRWMLQQVLVMVVISAVVAALILYFYARQEVVGSYFDAHVKIRRVSDLLLPVVVAGSVVSLIAGALLALFLPQKIAGPVYRIEMSLKDIECGDLTTKVRLRTNDTLQDLADSVNQAIAGVRDDVFEVKKCIREVEQLARDGGQTEILQCLDRQKEYLDRLKT